MTLILVHKDDKVVAVLDSALRPFFKFEVGKSVPKTLELIVKQNTNRLVVWCNQALLPYLDVTSLDTIFHHQRILASFNPTETNYLPEQLGYIERSFALNVTKKEMYPTWIMSGHVGGLNTAVLKSFKTNLNYKDSLDYFLTSIAKRGTTEGLFCYSDPKLLKPNYTAVTAVQQATTATLFKFVKQHYKWFWVFFLSFGYSVFEKKPTVFSLIKSLFKKQLPKPSSLESIPVVSSKKVLKSKTIDVIIPTIGRKQYLYDVLKDLEAQTNVPENVIIVEQNPLKGSVSELNYLKDQEWPFKIKHTFTHQSGVCNARNIALDQVESEWVFFADDDIRFNANFFQESFKQIEKYSITALNYLCLQPEQKQTYFKIHQTTVFGSGSSMVKASALKDLKFNMAYEFGFGEDTEFGMQLRNKGHDVIFMPDIKITHLKAPIGGYRTKVKQLWDDAQIQPKPSPTIMSLNQTYFTKIQLLGYKLLLAIRGYKNNKTKNPIAYIKTYNKQWDRSLYWSSKL